MKKNTSIKNGILALSIAITIITGVLSCADGTNANKTTLKESDSSDRKDNTIGNTVTNPREQDKMMSDSTNTNNTANNNNNAETDATFFMKAAEINMEEIKLGKLAQQKGTMSHVKALGKMLVTDHTQAMAGLNTLAKTKMINLPTTEGQKIMDAYKMLSEKKGKDFDKAYSDMMVNGHKEAIALFEKTNSDTKDADVKKMTATMIPKLKTHLEQAEICQKECEKM